MSTELAGASTVPRGHSRLWVTLAVGCIVGTLGPLIVGIVAEIYVLAFWGVLSAYLGIGWVVPGILVWLAVADPDRHRSRGRSLGGAAAGVATGVALLVVTAAVIAVGEGGLEDGGEPVARPGSATEAEASTDPPALVVRRAAGGQNVQAVDCAPLGQGFSCGVSLAGPACQLWMVVDDEATPVSERIWGGTVTKSERSVQCGT